MSPPGDDDRHERPNVGGGQEKSPSDTSGTRASESDDQTDSGSHRSDVPPSPAEWRSSDEVEKPPHRGDDTSETKLFVYDLLSSILAVLVVGAYLFAVSGVWPPLVAVESRSMVPNMQVNDLVFVMEEHRFPGKMAEPGTGVVTAQSASNGSYTKFGGGGDVIVFAPDGNEQTTPIIHRAMYWVDSGENWCALGNADHIRGLEPGDERCTADHGGFITKGDNNVVYDQATPRSGPVKPEWVVGTAEFRIPGLGWVRLSTQ
jgi:signal peptidase